MGLSLIPPKMPCVTAVGARKSAEMGSVGWLACQSKASIDNDLDSFAGQSAGELKVLLTVVGVLAAIFGVAQLLQFPGLFGVGSNIAGF